MGPGETTRSGKSRARSRVQSTVNPDDPAKNFYKARLTKGLFAVGVGEGPIVEILNFRTRKVLRRELFDDHEEARNELIRVRKDIENMTIDQFRSKYLQTI